MFFSFVKVDQLPVHVVHCNKKMNQHILKGQFILKKYNSVIIYSH